MNLTEAKEDIWEAADRFRQLAQQSKSPKARKLLTNAADTLQALFPGNDQ